MTKILISIVWFLVFTKLLVFWVWLWQLKEYHGGRFIAHFEAQALRKIFFSFHGIRYPKLTKKIVLVLASGIILEIAFLFLVFNSPTYILHLIRLIILAPIFASVLILLFQIPANILIKRVLKKAKQKRKRFENLTVIGISGSYGKTAVKEFLYEMLSEKFNVLKTKKNINAEIGIAQTILKELGSFHQIFIAEIGAYEIGKIKQVAQMIKPKIGILTGINEQHLSTFGSLENIKKAKNEILECSEIKIDYNDLDLIATNIIIEKEYVSFKINNVDFRVNLLGNHNIQNILLAASCAKKLGMSLEEISKACLKIKPAQGGMKLLKRNGLTILDASYSANPNGVIADLDYLNIYDGKKVIVMPCLIELGKESKQIHKRIGKKIAEVCDLAIITTKDYFKEIKGETETRVSVNLQRPGSLSVLLIENPENIVKKLKEFSPSVILLEGRIPKLIWH